MIKIGCLSDKRGFTVIEAFIASVIMAIGLFAVGTLIYTQYITLNKNREKTIAALTAQGEIEFLRGQPFDNIVSRRFYKDEAPGLEYLRYQSDFGRGDIVVESAGFTNNSNIKKVSAIVTWNSVNGKTLLNTMTTLMTNGGIDKQ